MYLSISNYYLNNIYLYQKNHQSILCKTNFAYQMTESDIYHKITASISNFDAINSINITNTNKLKLSINAMWSLKSLPNLLCSVDQPLKKNILLPSVKQIELAPNIIDLNPINCLCHDQTHIINIPNIILTINSQEYELKNWIGNNQVWCASAQDSSYYIYAYLYIFYTQSILLISQTSKNLDSPSYLDTDLISSYYHNNLAQDEYGRINCSEVQPHFSTVEVLNCPTNQNPETLSVQIRSNDILPN